MSSDSLLTSAPGGGPTGPAGGVPAPRSDARPAERRDGGSRGGSRGGSTAVPRTGDPGGTAADPVLRRAVDGLVDAAVVSFALWTLLYWLGLVTQWRLWPSGWGWLAATAALVGWQVLAAVRAPRPGPAAPVPARPGRSSGRLSGRLAPALALTGAAAATTAVVAAVLGWPATFPLAWVTTVLAAGALGSWAWTTGRLEPSGALAPGDRRSDLGVLLLAGGCAVLSLFVHLTDTDDPYYVNRSVWIAEHGNAALRDTMFSPEVYNTPYGGGVPISSFEALLGVLAHLTGIRAGTVTYLVATPVGTALAVWALWRLARRWAPARALLVLVVAVGFLLLSGDSMLGNFWLPRMWQGKVVAVAVLVPLVWAWLTEAADGDRAPAQRRRALALLIAGGVAFAGLTPTAVVWAPAMVGAALLAALLVRSRSLALGALLFLVGPLGSGLAVVAFSTGVGGEDPVALPSRESFLRVLGDTDPVVALALLALCLAPVAARRGVPAALASASALLAVLVYAPGVLPLLNAVTGSGPILWRMLYVAPVPVLVGLLAAYAVAPLSLPGRGAAGRGVTAVVTRVTALGVAVVLVGGLVAGRPVWSHTSHTGELSVTSRPEWKLDLPSLRDVRALEERGLLDGVVLLPPIRMKVLSMYTTDAFAVVPRDWFVRNIREPRADKQARRLLYDVVAARPPFPPPAEVGAALRRLDVTLACAAPSPYLADVVQRFEAAGYTGRTTVGSLTCVTAPG